MKAIVPRIVWSAKERTLTAEPSTISLGLLQNRTIVFIGSYHLKEGYTNNILLGIF